MKLKMILKLFLFCNLVFFSNVFYVEAIVIPDYENSLGGSREEVIYEIIDGGSGANILIGETRSMGSGDFDAYLLKIDYFGNIVWNRTYGGLFSERAYTALKLKNGGFLIAGSTTSFGSNDIDLYLIKTDSAGEEDWHKLIGGSGADWAESILVVNDGYVMAGSTQYTSLHDYNIYVVKTDENGDVQWSKEIISPGDDYGKCIVEAPDGGFLVLGNLQNTETMNSDIFLAKLDNNLTQKWNMTFGGESHEESSSLIKTSDGGYLIAGTTNRDPEKNYDILMIKLSPDFKVQWNKTYGGDLDDHGYSCIESRDNNFFLLGRTSDNITMALDFLLIEVDPQGNMLFSSAFGTPNSEYGMDLIETNYNDLILAGYTAHPKDVYVLRLRQNWLFLKSDYGELSGEGLYMIGQNATFNVSPTIIEQVKGERIIFTSWVSDVPTGYSGGENQHSMMINQETTETAIWEKQFQVSASIKMGYGTVLGTGWYKEGTEIKLSAIPEKNYSFIGWEGTGIDADNRDSNRISVIIDAPIELVANFQLNGTHYLDIKSEYGEVEGSDYYVTETKAFFSVEPEVIQLSNLERVVFDRWKSENESGYNGADNHAVVEVTSDITEVAIWKKQFYVIVEGATNTGLDGWYNQGGVINIPLIYEGSILRKALRVRSEEGKILSGSVQVNKPITLYCDWKTDYTIVYAITGLIVIALIAIFVYLKRNL